MKQIRSQRALQLAFLLCILLAWCMPCFSASVPSLLVGGGYGNSGATISSAGAFSMDGAFIGKGNFTLYDGSTARFAWTATTGGVVATPEATTGIAWYLNGSALTSGDLLKLTCLDATLNGGKYINCYGGTGTTSEFSIGEGGAVTAAGDVASATLTTGGGYGSTGCSIAATGNIQTNGTLTVDGASTLTGAVTVGTGYAGTGATLGATGAIQTKGALTVDGATTSKIVANGTITCAAGSTTLDATYYGKVTLISGNAAETIALPANGATAGTWMEFIIIGTDSTAPTFAAATADTLIAPNDAAADSVTFGTGHRIGACLKFISTGTFWVAVNIGSTTLSVTT
ncbi:MAG: hypothetical protein ABFD54_04500 [Armatimonadota bacterium]